jgi:MFS family permease
MSVMGPMIGVATVLGPLLGGFLTTSISWRWIFYINVPIGIAALIVTGVVLKLPRQHHKSHVDYWGTLTLGGAAACLVLLLTWGGRQFAWGSPVIIGLIVGTAILAAGFILAERRATEPIMPLRLFRDNAFRGNTALGVLIGVALFGVVSYLPTYLQISLGATATMSGVLMLPLMGGLMLAAVITGQLITRTGRYKIFPIIGAGVATVGMFLLSLMGADTPRAVSSGYMIVLGLGIGFIMPTLVLVVQNSVSQKDLGSATAGVNFFRQIGGSAGTAIIGSLFVGRLATNLSQNLPHSFTAKLGGHAQGVTTKALEKFPPQIAHDYVVSYANALTPLFAYMAPIILIGFIVAWFLKEKPLSTALARGAAAEKAPDAPAEEAQQATPPDEEGLPSPEAAASVAPAAVAPAVPDEEPGQRPELSEDQARALNTLHYRSAGARRLDGDLLPQRLFTPQQSGSNGDGNGHNGHHESNGQNGSNGRDGSNGHGTNGHSNGNRLAVTGSVYRSDRTAASANVTLLDLGGRQLEGASTDDDGTYHVALPGPGTYLLAVLPERGGGHQPVAELVTSAGDTVVRDIQLGES